MVRRPPCLLHELISVHFSNGALTSYKEKGSVSVIGSCSGVKYTKYFFSFECMPLQSMHKVALGYIYFHFILDKITLTSGLHFTRRSFTFPVREGGTSSFDDKIRLHFYFLP